MPALDDITRRALETALRRRDRARRTEPAAEPGSSTEMAFDPRYNARIRDQTGQSIWGLETWEPELEGN